VGPELILLVVVLIVVLVWRGPASLPRLGEALGKAVKGVRDNMPAGSRDDSDDHDPGGPSGSGGPPSTGPGT
jgi:Sec-independent protein translocase protein TatA